MRFKPLEEGLGKVVLDGDSGGGGGGIVWEIGRGRCIGDGGGEACMSPTGVMAVVEKGIKGGNDKG